MKDEYKPNLKGALNFAVQETFTSHFIGIEQSCVEEVQYEEQLLY